MSILEMLILLTVWILQIFIAQKVLTNEDPDFIILLVMFFPVIGLVALFTNHLLKEN
jgi:hypothetical protein